MKVTILGYWGGYPKDGGATSGYLVTTDEGNILIDCGSGVMSKLTNSLTVDELSGVVLSHLHYDHMADIGVIQYAALGSLRNGRIKDKLSLYAPNSPNTLWSQLQSEATANRVIDESERIVLAGVTIEFLSVNHTIPCFAMRFTYQDKVFVYSADTEYMEELVEFSKDADMLICEATICEGSVHTVGKGHMDAKEAGLIAKRANVKKLVLTHLPHDGDFAKMKELAASVFNKEIHLANEMSEYML
jgi:ribonuclease BN (tRNA processing enzyme)